MAIIAITTRSSIKVNAERALKALFLGELKHDVLEDDIKSWFDGKKAAVLWRTANSPHTVWV